jgi:hypothetical protein
LGGELPHCYAVTQAQMKLWQTLMLGKSFAHYSDNYAEKKILM